MDIKDIDGLIAKMEDKSLKRLVIKKNGFEIELERMCNEVVAAVPMVAPVAAAAPAPAVAPEAAAPPKKSGEVITSPIVGTFYASPSPNDPPYAKVGDRVERESIVCIIEAMKVMNEVKAGVSGKIVEILMKSGDPVEYGTVMFRVE